MGIPNLILYFPSDDSLDHKSPITCLRTDLNNFFFLWLGNLMGIPNPILYFTSNDSPQKFVIMIRCKIIFYIIWYSVIFAAALYLTIFVLSFDILSFAFMSVVFFMNFIILIGNCKCLFIEVRNMPIEYNLFQSVCETVQFFEK